MDKLKNVEKKVAEILCDCPASRDNDELLYYLVIESLGLPFEEMDAYTIFIRRAERGIPKFETVRRARQKIQAEDDSLLGSRPARKARKVMEKKYRDWWWIRWQTKGCFQRR